MTAKQREAARLSLEGLSVGDAFGQYVLRQAQPTSTIFHTRRVPPGPWRYSDDTVMALALYRHLATHGRVERDGLAADFGAHFQREPERGYGAFAYWLLQKLSEGGDWRTLSRQIYDGQGSMGNGSAMRVPPLGAFFAYDLDALLENARASAEVTHAHPEGQAGAIAIALAAAFAYRSRAGAAPSRQEFFHFVLAKTPKSETYKGIIEASKLSGATPEAAVTRLGDGTNVICPDTVPIALWCVAASLRSYKNALWLAAEATQQPKADRDTICAIVGGIVALSAGLEAIPAQWREAREALPDD